MSAEAASLARSWAVGPWTVTLTVPPLGSFATCPPTMEWAPALPDRKLTAAERRQYRTGRDKAIAELVRALGATIAVVEIR